MGLACPDQRPLRTGWTTGCCAAAAATAAFTALTRSGGFPDPVTIRLPNRLEPSFPLAHTERNGCFSATVGVLKDAGDDPDITHGALILATVELAPEGHGISFHAGVGVGRVTLPGLPLAVGEAAITAGPRAQITNNLSAVAGERQVNVRVTVSIPGGEALARKTLNERLGIVGGLSILGTTGVVLPYSCAAWVHSLHRGIDVARALKLEHIAASTGKGSEAWARHNLGLPEAGLIDMGDMVGGVLKYLRRHPVPRLTLVGGIAKLSKLAAGMMNLNVRAGAVDFDFLVDLLDLKEERHIQALRACRSVGQVLQQPEAHALGARVCLRARETALAALGGETAVAVVAVDRLGHVVGRS